MNEHLETLLELPGIQKAGILAGVLALSIGSTGSCFTRQ